MHVHTHTNKTSSRPTRHRNTCFTVGSGDRQASARDCSADRDAMRCLGRQMKSPNKKTWANLHVNGKPLNVPENEKFWYIVSNGEDFEGRVLEFVYKSSPEVLMKDSAIVIQAAWRKYVARRSYYKMRMAQFVISREFIKFRRRRREKIAAREAAAEEAEATRRKEKAKEFRKSLNAELANA